MKKFNRAVAGSEDSFTVEIAGQYFKVDVYDYSVDNPCFEISMIVDGELSEIFGYMGSRKRTAVIIKDGKTLKSTTYASYDSKYSTWSEEEYVDHLIYEVARDIQELEASSKFYGK